MVAVFFQMQMVQMAMRTVNVQRGGSCLRKATKIIRHYHVAYNDYMKKYFKPKTLQRPDPLVFDPKQMGSAFERRRRMPCVVFNHFINTCISHTEYIKQGLCPDCKRKVRITPWIKIIHALRILLYDIPANIADDTFNRSEITASLCHEAFCNLTKQLGLNKSLQKLVFLAALSVAIAQCGNGTLSQKTCKELCQRIKESQRYTWVYLWPRSLDVIFAIWATRSSQ